MCAAHVQYSFPLPKYRIRFCDDFVSVKKDSGAYMGFRMVAVVRIYRIQQTEEFYYYKILSTEFLNDERIGHDRVTNHRSLC